MGTDHVLVEVGELLDFLLDGSRAVRVVGDVEVVDLCLEPVQLVEGALDLLPPHLLLPALLLLGTSFHTFITVLFSMHS